jgi:4-amino-4-deoxy-L-arabinose transferase-like glycosyltransferase
MVIDMSNSFIYKNKIPQILLFTLLIISAVFLRIYDLDKYPAQINQDELSNIYDAYSIAETGADRWGNKYPIILRAFGDNDYRPPMYAWIGAISFKLFGVSVITGRIPSAIIGVFSLIILFAVARKIGGGIFAYLTLFIATLSPWHIIFSRLALEAAVLPSFFMILSIYLWYKVVETSFSNIYLILLGFVIGFATNSYQSSKLIFLILSVLALFVIAKKTSYNYLKLTLLASFLAIGAMPQIIALFTMPDHFFARANGTMIPLSFTLDYFLQIFKNIISCISPSYLFYSFGKVNTFSITRLLTFEAFFFYLGLFLFFLIVSNRSEFKVKYLYVILFVTLLPSALTIDTPHALRESTAIILYPMFSAAGILITYNSMGNRLLNKSFLAVVVLLVILNFLYFAKTYLNNVELQSQGHQSYLAKMAKKLSDYKDDYAEVLIEDLGNQPYIYIAYYCKIHPLIFQNIEIENNGIGWDHIVKIDKYRFLSIDEIQTRPIPKNHTSLIVVQDKLRNYHLIDSISADGIKWYFFESN